MEWYHAIGDLQAACEVPVDGKTNLRAAGLDSAIPTSSIGNGAIEACERVDEASMTSGTLRCFGMGDLNDVDDGWSEIRGCFQHMACLLYTSPSPRDGLLSRMPSSA